MTPVRFVFAGDMLARKRLLGNQGNTFSLCRHYNYELLSSWLVLRYGQNGKSYPLMKTNFRSGF